MIAIRVGNMRPRKYFPSEMGTICKDFSFEIEAVGVGNVTIVTIVEDIGTSSVSV